MVKKVTFKQVLNACRAIDRMRKAIRITPDGIPVPVTYGKKFVYGIVKNNGKMKDDFDGIVENEKEQYGIERERVKYCEDHAEKDAAGKPVIETDSTGRERYKGISEDDPGLKEIFDKKNKAIDAFNAFLKNETEIDLHEIAYEELPEEIAILDFEALTIMIGEPKEDKK